jgi:hypothetical protein
MTHFDFSSPASWEALLDVCPPNPLGYASLRRPQLRQLAGWLTAARRAAGKWCEANKRDARARALCTRLTIEERWATTELARRGMAREQGGALGHVLAAARSAVGARLVR